MASPFADILAALARAFEHAGLRWYLFGAQAAIIHGAARLTADVDVTVHLEGRPHETLVSALNNTGFVLRVPDPEFVAQTRVLPVTHVPSGIPADIVLARIIHEDSVRKSRSSCCEGRTSVLGHSTDGQSVSALRAALRPSRCGLGLSSQSPRE